MSAAAIVAQLRAARLVWVEVEPGIRVQIDTPSTLAAGRLHRALEASSDDAIAVVAGLVRGWEGVTGVTALGVGVGGDDPLPVSADLAALLLADRLDWLTTLGVAAINATGAALERAKAARGNSAPSSTGS